MSRLSASPERTCLACGRKTSKTSLLRISRTREGVIAIDLRQTMPGRGAYVCPTLNCARRLRKKKGLQRGLRTMVPDEIYEQLIATAPPANGSVD